ncbi:MAG: efflux transporter outer membrane subunit [Candidatus Binatia bacterium]
MTERIVRRRQANGSATLAGSARVYLGGSSPVVAAAALALSLVAGCATSSTTSPGVIAAKADLSLILPADWRAPTGDPAAAANDLDFGDPTLARLVAEALEANPDLQVAAARVAMAAADARIAGADLYPKIGLGGNGGRQRDVFVGFPVDAPGVSSPLSSTTSRLGVSLDISWELDVWGRVRAGREAAGADLAAAVAEWNGARLSLAAQTAKAWFALLEAREQLALAEDTLASWLASAEQVQARYSLGVRSPLDVRLSRTQVAGAEARASVRRLALENTARQLEVLLGRYPAAELADPAREAGRPLHHWASLQPVPAGIPAELLARRPDLVRAEQNVYAADRRVAAAKAALLPRIAITGSAGTVSDDFTHLLDGDFGVWSWAANLMQPILEGGRLRGAVSKAKAGAGAEVSAYISTALVAFAEVESALSGETHLAVTELALESAAREAAAAETLAAERYRSGLEDYVTLLDSRRTALEASSALLEARRRRLDNRVDLVLALGGGLDAAETP